MTSPSSFNVSGLLNSSIDTTTLIAQLMQAQAIPQTQLKNQLNVETAIKSAYQAINTKLTALQTTAQAVINPALPTDPTAWTAMAATSSNTGVVASVTGTASAGTTTFNVLKLASSQITTIAADGSGNVVTDPSVGITVNGQQVTATSASAADVASAINGANLGVRASVLQTDAGTVLQLASSTTGTDAAFSVDPTGFVNTPQTIAAAQNAQIGVGDPLAGGYAVSSQSNTFTGVIPGVTFTVSAVASNVSVTLTSDAKAISDKVKALVDAANAAQSEVGKDIAKGAILQGNLDVQVLASALASAVSNGVAGGGSLHTYGIDMDSNGVFSFDADAFQAAYTADPTGTRAAIAGSFAATLNSVATNASDPITGTITAAIKSASDVAGDLNNRIDDWTSRLADIHDRLTIKYNAMNTMLARLQSQSTYLTSMLKNLNAKSDASS